jgi:hypothetical protein
VAGGLLLHGLFVAFQDAGHTFAIFRFFGESFSFVHKDSMTHSALRKRGALNSRLHHYQPLQGCAVLFASNLKAWQTFPRLLKLIRSGLGKVSRQRLP